MKDFQFCYNRRVVAYLQFFVSLLQVCAAQKLECFLSMSYYQKTKEKEYAEKSKL